MCLTSSHPRRRADAGSWYVQLRVFLRAAVKMLIDNCMAPPDHHRLDRNVTTMEAAAGMLSRACCDLVRYVLRDYRTYARTPSAIIHRTNSDREREREKKRFLSLEFFIRTKLNFTS